MPELTSPIRRDDAWLYQQCIEEIRASLPDLADCVDELINVAETDDELLKYGAALDPEHLARLIRAFQLVMGRAGYAVVMDSRQGLPA